MGDYTPDRDYSTTPLIDADNLNPGEGSNAAKAVDAELLGVDFVDHQKYTKAFTSCLVDSLVTAAGEATLTTPTNVIDLEHRVQIVNLVDGRVWEGLANADDTIKIQNAPGAGKCHLISGVNVADYTTYGTATDFYICTVGSTNYRRLVGADGIAKGVAPGAFNSDDLLRSPTNLHSVDDTLTDLENNFAVGHDDAGEHLGGFLKNIHFDPNDALIGEGFKNVVDNSSFEFWDDGEYDIPPSGWSFTGAAGTVLSKETAAANVYQGDASCKIVSVANGDMLHRSIASASFYANKKLSGYVYIKGTAGRKFNAYLWGNVSGNPGVIDQHTLTGGWDRFTISRTMGADTDIQIRIVRDDVNNSTFYIDAVNIQEGRIVKAWSPSDVDAIEIADDREPYNFLLNPNFDIWQETNETPMGWESYAGGAMTIARNTTTYFGKYGLTLTPTNNGEGITQKPGDIDLLLDYFKGKTVTFSAWILQSAAINTVYRIQLEDNAGTSENDFDINSYGIWTRISVTRTVDAAATRLNCNIFRNDIAAGTAVYISNGCLNIGSRPLDAIGPRPSVWTARDLIFWRDGSCPTGTILAQKEDIVETLYPIYLAVRAGTASATKAFDFKLFRGVGAAAGVDTGFAVQLAIAGVQAHEKQSTLDSVNTDILAPKDYVYIQAVEVPGVPGDPADVRVTLKCMTLSL